jgi:hypothetical protein
LLAVLVAVAVGLVAPGLASAATGTMTGQVFGPDDAPLAGAQVTVRGPDGSPLAGVRVRAYGAAGNVVATYTTVADGVYTLRYLRTAGYRIGLTAPAGSGLADEFHDNAATLGEASSVTATSGSLTAGIDALLEPAGPAPT